MSMFLREDGLKLCRNNEPKKLVASKIVQVSLGVCMSDENFCSDLPSEKYWNLVAEKKR